MHEVHVLMLLLLLLLFCSAQGTFVKFQPQSVDFLEISNPRAVLETTMRHFSCLTEGDVICIPYNDRVSSQLEVTIPCKWSVG